VTEFLGSNLSFTYKLRTTNKTRLPLSMSEPLISFGGTLGFRGTHFEKHYCKGLNCEIVTNDDLEWMLKLVL
jgi:hypothetical protein